VDTKQKRPPPSCLEKDLVLDFFLDRCGILNILSHFEITFHSKDGNAVNVQGQGPSALSAATTADGKPKKKTKISKKKIERKVKVTNKKVKPAVDGVGVDGQALVSSDVPSSEATTPTEQQPEVAGGEQYRNCTLQK
jgi:hypothetical protein